MGITTNIRDRLVVIETSMTYGGSALDAARYVSEGIQDHQCPLFVNFHSGRATSRKEGSDYQITRNWILKLIVRSTTTGLRSENEFMADDLIDLTYDTFVTHPRLEYLGVGLTDVESAELTGDSDVVIEPYPRDDPATQMYYVVNFGLQVIYRSFCE
jgi:hypothetical protein